MTNDQTVTQAARINRSQLPFAVGPFSWEYIAERPEGMVTLAALCNTVGLRIDEEAERELARVWTKIDAIRAKQAAKPTGSALPVALSAPQGDDKTILKELRPSKKAMEKIDRIAQANAAGMAALRDMPLGSAAPQGEVERLREALVAIRQRGIERDVKWAGMNAHDIARAALAQPEAGGE